MNRMSTAYSQFRFRSLSLCRYVLSHFSRISPQTKTLHVLKVERGIWHRLNRSNCFFSQHMRHTDTHVQCTLYNNQITYTLHTMEKYIFSFPQIYFFLFFRSFKFDVVARCSLLVVVVNLDAKVLFVRFGTEKVEFIYKIDCRHNEY